MHHLHAISYTADDQGYVLRVDGQEQLRCESVALLFDAGANKVLAHGDAGRMLALHGAMQREALAWDSRGDRADELVWIEAAHAPAEMLTQAVNGDLGVIYLMWRRHRYSALTRTDAVLRTLLAQL